MMPNILARTEEELKRYLDLSDARVTRTDRSLKILVSGRQRGRKVERCFALGLDGRWEITGYHTPGEQARILIGAHPVRGGGGLPTRSIQAIVRALRTNRTAGGTK